jgi:hypothetical protein
MTSNRITNLIVIIFLAQCACGPTYTVGNIEVDYSKRTACKNEVSNKNVSAVQCIQSDETLQLTAIVIDGNRKNIHPEYTVELVQISDRGKARYFRRCHKGEKCPEEDGSEAIIYGNRKLCVKLGCGEDTGPLGGYSFCVNKEQIKGGCID